MSKRKILVIGDSFAVLDPDHSHWVDVWAQQHDIEVEHFAHPGNNAVNIVSEFEIVYKEPYDFDYVVFQVPDFFRSEVASVRLDQPVTPVDRIDYLTELFKNKSFLDCTINDNSPENFKEFLPNYFTKFSIEHVQTGQWLGKLDQSLKDYSFRDRSFYEHTARFYESASPRWLFRSNLTALKYFNALMSSNDIPCCFALNPGTSDEEIDSITSTINLNFWPMKVRSENIGRNHISLTFAQECATLFEQYNSDRKLFLVS
jgi:hypothetical protein